MIEINLLPKEYQKKRFQVSLEKNALYVVGGGIAMLVLLAAYTVLFQALPIQSLNDKIAEARQDSLNMASEIKLVNDLTDKKNQTLTRMRTIELLDLDRGLWIDVVSDLGRRIPDYLWLTDFKQAPVEQEGIQQLTIQGRSFSLNSLATFIIKLKKSPYYEDIEISTITLVEEQGAEVYSFDLKCKFNLVRAEKELTQNNLLAGNLAAGSEF